MATGVASPKLSHCQPSNFSAGIIDMARTGTPSSSATISRSRRSTISGESATRPDPRRPRRWFPGRAATPGAGRDGGRAADRQTLDPGGRGSVLGIRRGLVGTGGRRGRRAGRPGSVDDPVAQALDGRDEVGLAGVAGSKSTLAFSVT